MDLGVARPRCPICYEPLKTDAVFSLSCGHTFDDRCIRVWLAKSVVCPCCRSPAGSEDLTKVHFVFSTPPCPSEELGSTTMTDATFRLVTQSKPAVSHLFILRGLRVRRFFGWQVILSPCFTWESPQAAQTKFLGEIERLWITLRAGDRCVQDRTRTRRTWRQLYRRYLLSAKRPIRSA